MKQVINILLKLDKRVERIGRKYGALSDEIKPHITLVYPFEINDQKELTKHIENVISKSVKFKITLKGLRKSEKGYYLYLLVNRGRDKILELYKGLNSGILSGFENKDMPSFVPHISLGIFNSEEQINKAIKEIGKQNLKVECLIDKINLLTLEGHKIISFKEFKLK